MPYAQEKHIASTWSETGKVHIYDLTQAVDSLEVPGTPAKMSQKPLCTINQHGRDEGYAMDWSRLDVGR
jgi:ribosome assembly protein RRB1